MKDTYGSDVLISQLLASDLYSIGIHKRTITYLAKENIHTVAELSGKTLSEISNIKNIGRYSLRNIRYCLARVKLHLKNDNNWYCNETFYLLAYEGRKNRTKIDLVRSAAVDQLLKQTHIKTVGSLVSFSKTQLGILTNLTADQIILIEKLLAEYDLRLASK